MPYSLLVNLILRKAARMTKINSTETMSSALPGAQNYHKWLFSVFAEYIRGSVLEIGMGYGQYTPWIAQKSDRLTCVDIDPSVLGAIPVSDAITIEGKQADLGANDFPATLGQGFDTVICLNVLEHINDDKNAVKNIFTVLSPGGRAFILVPAHQCLYGPLDKLAGHVKRYSRETLQALVEQSGLKVEKSGYLNPIGGAGWWLNAKLCKPCTLSDDSVNAQIVFFDRYLLPVSRLINPLFSRFFGQSTWIVARKPLNASTE